MRGNSLLVPETWAIVQTARSEDPTDHAKTTFTQDSEIKHEGRYSLKISISEPGGEITIFNRSRTTWHPTPFDVEPGKLYTLRGWIRTQNIQAGSIQQGSFSIRFANNEKKFFADDTKRQSKRVKLPQLDDSNKWTAFELSIDAKNDDTWCFIAIYLPAGIQGTVWIDDLSLTRKN